MTGQNEEKLSVRLEAAADTPYDLRDLHGRADLLREAAQLARRVEEAPSYLVSAMPGTNGGFGVIVPAYLAGQRVRLVREN